jgi:hydrogenase maturation protease
MEGRGAAVVLGIGNVLWADEGFGVRAVEALHAAYAFPADVLLLDGGTLGLNLYEYVAAARRVLVFDAIDFHLPPGTLKVLRDAEVPAWGRTKLSPHQTGFNDVLALAQLNGHAPETIVAIGVQPVELSDFGGSLTEPVKERLPDNIAEMTDPMGVPEVIRPGSDITIVTYGACCRIALDAADKLSKAGIDAEVIDVQSLLPLDIHGRIHFAG